MIDDTIIIDFAKEIDLAQYLEKDKPSSNVVRKFTETLDIKDYQVLTDNGFVDILGIGKTIPYLKYKIKTRNHELECADEHIVIDGDYDEVFVKDLNKDSRPDTIITESGPEIVEHVINTGEYEEMYDLKLDENSNHLYFTNGILSHNSIWLANDASNFVKAGCNTAFITAEMKASKVVKRIGANLLDITMSEYDKCSADKNLIARKLQTVGTGLMPPGKLFIKKFPTSQATIIDIENYLTDVEQTAGIKLNAIVIDYINILSNYRNPNSDNTYMKIKQIAEDLRGMADRNNWLIITACQIKRCLTLDTIVEERIKGKIEIKFLNEADEILSETGYVKVKKIHPVEKQKVFLIKTKSGEHIKMSANHITPTVYGGLKKTSDLLKTDRVFIKSFTNNSLKIDKIYDIVELEKEDTIDIEIDSSSRTFFANNILTHNSGYDSSDISMDDIAESAGLSHTADMIYGIIQDSIMHSNFEYWLKILKIRDGEGKNTKCRFDINYDYMRLSETDDIRGNNRAT